jgi:nicotinate-nucleotide--dimethylbenzimidazole phosphoribosyltransferase
MKDIDQYGLHGRLEELNASVCDTDAAARERARRRWDEIAKPIRGLGLMEEAIIRLAGIQRTHEVCLSGKCVVVMCADHGVIREGVSQADEAVTRIVAENFTRGRTSCAIMAKMAGADVFPVDIGMAEDAAIENRKIARGTANMLTGPAMTREQACAAVLEGAGKARELAGRGYRLAAVGEMGAGNTTAASAVSAVILGLPPHKAAGRGAGLSDEAYRHKIAVIEASIERNRPDADDPLDVLSKVGGFDIAGMAGVFLGCAANGMAAVADGLISLTAALVAVRLCPAAAGYILPSHRPAEPAGEALLKELCLRPVLDCGLALGEGAGAVMLFPLLDMAAAVYAKMDTFDEINVGKYRYHAGEAGR